MASAPVQAAPVMASAPVQAAPKKDASTAAAGTKPVQQWAPAPAVPAHTRAAPMTDVQPVHDMPNLEAEKAKLKNLNVQLNELTVRLRKVEAADLEIREDKLAEEQDFDHIHQIAFQRIHKELFSMVKDAYQIGDMAKNIITAKNNIEAIIRAPWNPRPVNGHQNLGRKHHVVLVKVAPIPTKLIKETRAEHMAPVKSAKVPVKVSQDKLVKPFETKAIIKPQSETKKVVTGQTATAEGTVNNKTSNMPVVAAQVVRAAPKPMIPAVPKVSTFEKRRAEIIDTMRDFKQETDPKKLPKTVTAKSAPNDAPVVRNPGQAMVIIFY
jgi:hypothetical protein